MKKLLLNAVAICLVFTASAQIRTPQPSPTSTITQNVGLSKVEIEYSRPSKKDRTIFAADGLVPYGQIWRTGANSATKITFSDNVWIGGQELKAGSYALLTTPSEKDWKVMFYPHEGGNFGTYVEKTPTVTATATVKPAGRQVETFTIELNDLKDDAANLNFVWDNTVASLPLKFEVDKRVMADIERVMAGPSANDYFAAASYMHDSGKDLNKALEYVKKANSMGEPRFWMLRRESLILADMGRTKEAIEAAQKSLAAAEKANNQDYIRMNKKSIEEWNAKEKKGGK